MKRIISARVMNTKQGVKARVCVSGGRIEIFINDQGRPEVFVYPHKNHRVIHEEHTFATDRECSGSMQITRIPTIRKERENV